MKKETYTTDEIQDELNISPTVIGTLMKRYGFAYEIKFGRKHYPAQGFRFLKEMFKTKIEIVEVHKYIEIPVEIYPSKMNFE